MNRIVSFSRAALALWAVLLMSNHVEGREVHSRTDAISRLALLPVYFGYCEVDQNGRLDGECTSHNKVGMCYIQPSTDCKRGRRARNVGFVSCGGFGSDRVDLARTCHF